MKSNKWAVSGGPSIELGAVFSGSAKVLSFKNLQNNKQKNFLMVSMGVGAKLEASFEAGTLLDSLLNHADRVKKVLGVTGNPFTVSDADKITVHTPFSAEDLYGAFSVGLSAGTDAGVVTVATQGVRFYSTRTRSSLFTMSGVQIEAIIGVGINIYTLSGGQLFGIPPNFGERIEAHRRADWNAQRKFGFRPHPGKM